MAVDRRTMLRVGVLLVGLTAIGLVVAASVVGGGPDARRTATTARRAQRAAVLTVVAHPNITFDRNEYVVPAGRVELHLTGAPGISLMFDDRRFRSCQLALGQTAAGRETGPRSCTVTLKPGRYLVYDMIAGHRAAGLEATIVAE